MEYFVIYAISIFWEKTLMNMRNPKHTLGLKINIKKIKNPRTKVQFTILKTEVGSFSPSYLNASVEVKNTKRTRNFMKTILTLELSKFLQSFCTLIKQPYSRLQVSFCGFFDKEGYSADEVKKSSFENVNDVFVNLKKKQMMALEDLDLIDTESEFIAYVGKPE